MVEMKQVWVRSLLESGYATFPGLVDRQLIASSRRRIDDDLRSNYDPARQIEYDNRSFCPEIRSAPPIERLFSNKAVSEIFESALGLDQISHSPGQIAIRQAHNADRPFAPHPHIDGIPTGENGVAGVNIQSFTALLGVFLSEVKGDFRGNFTVWPGSHILLQDHFRREGPSALSQGMPQIPLGDPIQLHGDPGDVVLCHYQLAHAAAVNLSDNDRYAVFFRIWVHQLDAAFDPNAEANRWAHLTSIWQGWKLSNP